MSAPEVNANTAVDAPAANTAVQDQPLDTGASVDNTNAADTGANADTGAASSSPNAEKKKGNFMDKLKTQFEKLTHPNKNKGGADTGATTTSDNAAGTTEATTATT